MKHFILLSLLINSAFSAEIAAVGFNNGSGTQPSTLDVVLSGINSAKKTIYVAAYAFTSKPIATALVSAKNRGVDIKVVADQKENTGSYSVVTYLANSGIPVRLDSDYKIFHNKFMVIDSKCVELGSYNYTKAASQNGSSGNAENAIIVCDNNLANIYTSQFSYWFNQAQQLKSNY